MSGWNPHANSIFARAIEIEEPDRRQAFIARACRGSGEVRTEVERLLRAHDTAGSFLDSTVCSESVEAVEVCPGQIVGRYRLLERIGEGGFADVYRAEQTEPVRRAVALKIIKPGMDTRSVIARFEGERQALALMDHPNIARVFDAGATETGRPYFVMELVRGVPITRYCQVGPLCQSGPGAGEIASTDHSANSAPEAGFDKTGLLTRDRLELFLDVCRAVQHAHQKGIIHRDLKPSNILIEPQPDGRGIVKVIDFGIAKATQQRLTERTLATETGQLLGTPEYMSPEQATFQDADVDTRSDIYSLGVLLYELLTGTTPFDGQKLRRLGYDEICRTIRETEPQAPSRRIARLAVQNLPGPRRRPLPSKDLLLRDLDWIVMKALEKDRDLRYAAVIGLARDVERTLNEEPIEARPPSAAYKLRKFFRRNRKYAVAVSAVLLALVLGIAGTTLGMIRATAANAVASREAARAVRAEKLQQSRSQEAVAEAAKATALVGMLREMLISSDDRGAKGRNYTVRELLEEFSVRMDHQPVPQPELEAELRTIIGHAYGALGILVKADAQLKRALELRRSVFGSSHPKVVDSLQACAWNASARHLYAEAETLARNTVAIAQELGDQKLMIATQAPLQNFLNLQDKFDEADAIGCRALAAVERLGLDDELVSSDVRLSLAGSRLGQRRTVEAEHLAKEALAISIRLRGEEHIATTNARECLARILKARENYAEAEITCRQVLASRRRYQGNAHPHVAGTLAHLGGILVRQGDYAGAEATFLEAQQIAEQLAGDEPTEAAYQYLLNTVRWSLASLYVTQGMEESALAVWSDAIALERENAEAWFWRGELHRRQLSQWEQALADYDQALQLDPGHSAARDKLAWILVTCPDVALRNPNRAIELAKEAIARAPDDGAYWNTLGVAYYRCGDWQRARSALERALQLSGMRDFSFNGYFLAMVHWRLGHEEQARRLYGRAVEWMQEHRPSDERLRQFQAEANELLGRGDSVRETLNK